MKKELKVALGDPSALEKKLLSLGATLTERKDVVDTYFTQPVGRVLKLTESKSGNTLTKLRAQGGGFVVENTEVVSDSSEAKGKLVKEFGIRCELKKEISWYQYKEFTVSIHRIRDLGNFLIIEGETPQRSMLTGDFGIRQPVYITESFDTLKISKGK